MDPGGIDALADSGLGSSDSTMAALTEGGFGTGPRPGPDYADTDRTIFRPLRPIVEYDARSDPADDFGSGLAYQAEEPEPEPQRNLGPVVGVSAIVLIASGLYVLTKPSS
jgi:hypothetical protein